jgi:hypothetical protein
MTAQFNCNCSAADTFFVTHALKSTPHLKKVSLSVILQDDTEWLTGSSKPEGQELQQR